MASWALQLWQLVFAVPEGVTTTSQVTGPNGELFVTLRRITSVTGEPLTSVVWQVALKRPLGVTTSVPAPAYVPPKTEKVQRV